jgi:hypothetical protein
MNKITNFLCLSLLLLGATALGMDTLDERLIHAAVWGSLDELERLIAQSVSLEVEDDYGRTPLILAAAYGHRAVCRLLIENKASVEAKDNRGRSPLIEAAADGHEDVCRLLIANKALVEAESKRGWTPLMFAAAEGHKAVCKLLIDAQVEEARENKATIATFLGIVRKRCDNLPCHMHYDVAKIIAFQVFQLAKWPVIKQINMIENKEKRAKWFSYLNQQMNSINK